jgi:hypothetical protein
MKIVTLHYDRDIEDPSTYDGAWKLYSFNRRHRSNREADQCFVENDEGDRVLRDDLQQKLAEGLAFLLDYYEHGGCAWSLSGGGMQCQWDTARRAGLLVWEHKPEDMGAKTPEDRAKDAKGFLEVYNAWCNGEGYGYSIVERVTLPCGHTEDKDLDSCFGFYGTDLDYFKSEIIAALDGETDIKLAGEAKDMFDVGDFMPKKKEKIAEQGIRDERGF